MEPTAFLAVLMQVMKIQLFSIPLVQPSPCGSAVNNPRHTPGLVLSLSPMVVGPTERDGVGQDRTPAGLLELCLSVTHR